jgi:hypothetical protein
VDQFIDARLARMGLAPAPIADRRTLIRRVTYDLIGLPPTPEEIETFVRDPDPDGKAFEAVVERLLASPHYGEHWGRHWLDIVRYADSSGFANDFERGNAWRYRDYVIRSFNRDKPYDQFIREQIAGDEMAGALQRPEVDARQDETAARAAEGLIAAGFLRLGPRELTGMEVARVARQKFLDDVTDIIGQVFLSHPLQCARCHDHKFDPIPTRDFYRLQAVFATTQFAERQASFLPEENLGGFEERQYLLERRRKFEADMERLEAREEAAGRAWSAERGLDFVPRNEGLKRGLAEDQLVPRHVGYTVEDHGMDRIARKGLERLRWELERYEPFAFSVYSGRTPEMNAVLAPLRVPQGRMTHGTLEASAILTGGDPFSPSKEVTPGVLSMLPGSNDLISRTPFNTIPDSIAGRRTALAAWLVHPKNPLPARSFVNRVWQWHFGRSLAGNPNNFGATGKKPTHPELLDWLAATFVESGWSVKAMHRIILSPALLPFWSGASGASAGECISSRRSRCGWGAGCPRISS